MAEACPERENAWMAASFWEKGSVPANLTRSLKGVAGVSVSRRENHIVGPLFSGGLRPVETFLGADSRLQRRMGLDRDLRNGTLPQGRSVKRRWLRDRLPRFVIRAYSERFSVVELGWLNSLSRFILSQLMLNDNSTTKSPVEESEDKPGYGRCEEAECVAVHLDLNAQGI